MTNPELVPVAQRQTRRLYKPKLDAGSIPAGDTIAPDLEYITADLCGDARHLPPKEMKRRRHWPAGMRGYLVLRIGETWAHLFSPVALTTFKVPIDEFDSMRGVRSESFDPAAMEMRIRVNRRHCETYGRRYHAGDTALAIALLEQLAASAAAGAQS